MNRYEIIALKRANRGFKAVIIDNKHPSGTKGVPIQWFETVEKAEAKLKAAKISYKVTDQGAA